MINFDHPDAIEFNFLEQYVHNLKTMNQQFIEPAKRYADLIVSQGGENNVPIELMPAHIAGYLRK